MKTCVVWCILAIFLFLTQARTDSSAEQQHPEELSLIDDELREFLEFIRLQMPCGYEDGGIPPLAPYELSYKDFHFQRASWEFKGNLTDFILHGLDGFEIAKLNWNNLLQKISFDLNFESLQLLSSYKMDAFGPLINHQTHIFGNGLMRLEFRDLRVHGGFRIRPSLSGNAQIWAFKVQVALGRAHSTSTGIMNSKIYSTAFNRWFEEFLDLTINDGTEEVSEFLAQLVVPAVNNALRNVSIKKLIDIILSAGSGGLPNTPFC